LGARPVCFIQEFFQEKDMRIQFGTWRLSRSNLTFLMLLVWCCAPQIASAQPASGAAPQQTVAQKIAASKDLLDINTATPEQLKGLPGMGEAYAQRVIAGRPYTAKNQLTTRGILPAGEYDKIKPLIIAHRVKK
jgi:competence protein ComEA